MKPIVYIHTRGRAGKVKTLKWLPRKLLGQVWLVVREDEAKEYSAEYPGEKLLVLPKKVNGLSATRQWILEREKDGRYFLMLDDDITSINIKKDINEWGLKGAKPKQVEDMMKLVITLVKDIPMVGLSKRIHAAPPAGKMYRSNARLSQFFMIDRKKVLDIGARFDRVPLGQDCDMVLQCLKAGLPNRCLVRFSYNERVEDSKGGCSLYRNDKLKIKTWHLMAKLHPGVVHKKMREPKPGYTSGGHYLLIQYKKAAKIGGLV